MPFEAAKLSRENQITAAQRPINTWTPSSIATMSTKGSKMSTKIDSKTKSSHKPSAGRPSFVRKRSPPAGEGEYMEKVSYVKPRYNSKRNSVQET